jgi:hypothetical protein
LLLDGNNSLGRWGSLLDHGLRFGNLGHGICRSITLLCGHHVIAAVTTGATTTTLARLGIASLARFASHNSSIGYSLAAFFLGRQQLGRLQQCLT